MTKHHPDKTPHPLAAMVAEMEARGWVDLRINLREGTPNVTLMASRATPPEWPGPPGYPAAWSEASRRQLGTNAGCTFELDHLAKILDRELEKHSTPDPADTPNC